MQRDMDLVRQLLLRLEACKKPPMVIRSIRSTDPEIAIEGYSPEQIDAHLDMIYQQGFVDYGNDIRWDHGGSWHFRSLTWQGRDFLDAVREPKVWAFTKDKAKAAGGWTVELLVEIAKAYIKGQLVKHGVPL